jgi:ABC-2 type transport system ATP-binding protein
MSIHLQPNAAHMTMNPLLEVRNLVKTYKTLTAVDDVSFAIPRGICFGLLGPNGAGKPPPSR